MNRDELVANIAGGEIISEIDLSGLNLAGANLSGAVFEKVSLRGADLTGATLKESSLVQCDLSGAKLARANMHHTIVATCNLKRDDSGDVRPGAKAVDAQAALAIPVHAAAGGLRAVVGIAFLGERDFSEDELSAFELAAATLPSA